MPIRSSALASCLFALGVACAARPQEAARCPEPAPAAPAPRAEAPAPSAREPGQPAIVHDLPRASELVFPAPAPEMPGATSYDVVSTIFAVSIDKDDRVYFADRPIGERRELIELARQELAKDPNLRAVIRADRRTSWGSVVEVLDLLKQGGVAKLAFAVEPSGRP